MSNVNLVSLSLKQRTDLLTLFAVSSGMKIIDISKSDCKRFVKFTFSINDANITIHAMLKNVVNSGWADKTYIKRIQVPALKFEELHLNKNNTYSFLVGFVYVDDEPFICVWNPFRFTFHNTVRSCYVLEESLIKTANENQGFLRTVDSNKELIICDKYHFKELINEFIKRNDIS